MDEALAPGLEFLLDDELHDVGSLLRLDAALDAAAGREGFELFVSVAGDGPILSMLRSGPHAWLMYLREPGDAGFHSIGEATREGDERYTLSNGQVDQYPLAWCIPLERCWNAVTFFAVNDGARPAGIDWVED